MIDQYTFTTGAHVLRIEFIDVQGNSGSFEYLFQGQVRESKFVSSFRASYSNTSDKGTSK